MCKDGKCKGTCPAAQFLKDGETCGKEPQAWRQTTFGMFLRESDFFPPVVRAINGHVIEEAQHGE